MCAMRWTGGFLTLTLYDSGQQTFAVKSQGENIFSFVYHTVSVTTTQLCCWCAKAALDNTQTNEHSMVPGRADCRLELALGPRFAYCYFMSALCRSIIYPFMQMRVAEAQKYQICVPCPSLSDILEFVSHLPRLPHNFSYCPVAFIIPFSSLFIIPITTQYSLESLVHDWWSSYWGSPSLSRRKRAIINSSLNGSHLEFCTWMNCSPFQIWNYDYNHWAFHFPPNLYSVPIATAFASLSPHLGTLDPHHRRGLDHLILGLGRCHELDFIPPPQFWSVLHVASRITFSNMTGSLLNYRAVISHCWWYNSNSLALHLRLFPTCLSSHMPYHPSYILPWLFQTINHFWRQGSALDRFFLHSTSSILHGYLHPEGTSFC